MMHPSSLWTIALEMHREAEVLWNGNLWINNESEYKAKIFKLFLTSEDLFMVWIR
jgi:hypothetical protein